MVLPFIAAAVGKQTLANILPKLIAGIVFIICFIIFVLALLDLSGKSYVIKGVDRINDPTSWYIRFTMAMAGTMTPMYMIYKYLVPTQPQFMHQQQFVPPPQFMPQQQFMPPPQFMPQQQFMPPQQFMPQPQQFMPQPQQFMPQSQQFMPPPQ